MKKLISSVSLLTAFLLSASPALAHVVVKPTEVGVAAFQTFTTSVPNEKDVAVVGLRVSIPDGLKSVSPTVKPGWTIAVKKTGEGEDAKVSEISWTGGSIPADQRDDFSFSAQAPSDETTLVWKAYQTYADGTIVAWDQAPKDGEEEESETSGPYSETKVVNDLDDPKIAQSFNEQATTFVAYGALLLAAISLALILRSRRS